MKALQPYPAYRDSRSEWLAEVPTHWEVRRLKGLVRILNGATPASGRSEYWGGDILWITPEDLGQLRTRDIRRSRRSITRIGYESCGTTLGPVGSTVMSTRAPIGHLAILGREGCTNQGCRLLVPREDTLVPEWAYLGLLTARSELQALGQGTTFSELSRDALGAFSLPLPPLPEQTTIARFLDDADRRIRHYIRAKERLIELLEEERRATIHEAVTGRIDVRTGQPYPAYKDSGVEWLGEVPEHWEVAGLGYRYEQCLGKMLDGKRITGEHLVPYLRNIDVQWDEINVADLPQMDIRPDEMPRYTVQPGDLLVCEGGEVGRCAIWRGEIDPCGFQKALHRLRPRNGERDTPRFLYYGLAVAVTSGAFADGHESTIAHLTGEKLRRHRFAFPSADEQTAIARFLAAAGRRLSARRVSLARQIALLREYRTRLIADVVTGKLDVREAAADLPETAPLADDRARPDAIPAEPNPHSTERDMMKEAIP